MERNNSTKIEDRTRIVCNEAKSKSENELFNLPADDFFELLESSSLDELENMITGFESPNCVNGAVSLHQSQGKSINKSNMLKILLFWELRRPLFNLMIGLCGMVVLITVALLNHAPALFLLSGAFYHFLTVNVIYTLTMAVDMVIQTISERHGNRYSKRLLKGITLFSVLFTLTVAVILPLTMLLTRPFG